VLVRSNLQIFSEHAADDNFRLVSAIEHCYVGLADSYHQKGGHSFAKKY